MASADLQVRPGAHRAECAVASDCAPDTPEPAARDTQIWRDTAALHQYKVAFVDAIRRFTEAQSGTCGHEGAALVRSLQSMKATLERWDDAIRPVERTASKARASADAHAALATVYLERRRDSEALAELRAADAIEHGRADINVMLALGYDVNGRSGDALRALKSAAAAEPENPATHYRIAQHLIEIDKPDEAIAAMRRVVRLLSRGAGAKGRRALAFERVDLFRQDAATAPIFATHRYQDGYARLDEGRYAEGVAAFESAAAHDPLVASASASSSSIVEAGERLCAGEPRAAIALLEIAGTDPAIAGETERVLGSAYWVAGDHNGAVAHLRAAVRANPGDDRSRETLALVLRASDRPTESEQVLRDALAAFPSAGRAAYMLGELLEAQSMPSDAVAVFESSALQGPVVGRDSLFKRIGGLHMQRAGFDNAIGAYRRRVNANPNSGEAHRQLADVYFLQGRDDFALAEYVLASRIDPEDARAAAGAAQVYLRGQRYPDAVAAAQRAIALDPALKESRYALAMALTRSGDADAGRREMVRFSELQAQDAAAGQREFRMEALRREAFAALASAVPVSAVALFRQLATERHDSRSLTELGAALLRTQQAAEAIPPLESAVALQPSAAAYRNLADAYAAVGNAGASRNYAALHDAAVGAERLRDLRDLTVH